MRTRTFITDSRGLARLQNICKGKTNLEALIAHQREEEEMVEDMIEAMSKVDNESCSS